MCKIDVERNLDPLHAYYSMDMQKIMIPHLPRIKIALFTRRILVINRTTAPQGGKVRKRENCMLWHECIQGRNDEDVASAVVIFLYTGVPKL